MTPEDTREQGDHLEEVTAGHTADAGDGTHGMFGEHITDDGKNVGRPGLVSGGSSYEKDLQSVSLSVL